MKAIVLACSRTKGAKPAAVIDLYDGPRWRTLRAALRQCTVKPSVFAFSAMHGILESHIILEPYDHNIEKVGWAIPLKGLNLLEGFELIHLSMGRDYAERLIPNLRSPYEWTGDRGLGDQRAAIYRFLFRYDMEMAA